MIGGPEQTTLSYYSRQGKKGSEANSPEGGNELNGRRVDMSTSPALKRKSCGDREVEGERSSRKTCPSVSRLLSAWKMTSKEGLKYLEGNAFENRAASRGEGGFEDG